MAQYIELFNSFLLIAIFPYLLFLLFVSDSLFYRSNSLLLFSNNFSLLLSLWVLLLLLLLLLFYCLGLSGYVPVAAISLLQFDTESNRYSERHHFIYQSHVSLSLNLCVITSLNKTLFLCVIIISTLRFSCKGKPQVMVRAA